MVGCLDGRMVGWLDDGAWDEVDGRGDKGIDDVVGMEWQVEMRQRQSKWVRGRKDCGHSSAGAAAQATIAGGACMQDLQITTAMTMEMTYLVGSGDRADADMLTRRHADMPLPRLPQQSAAPAAPAAPAAHRQLRLLLQIHSTRACAAASRICSGVGHGKRL